MNKGLNDKKILKSANKILSKYKVCDHCLGRVFAKIESGITNQKRGLTLRKNLRTFKKTKVENCWLCYGLLNEIQHFVDLILWKI